MKTIALKLDEALLAEIDRVGRMLSISRLERQHAQGYARHPVKDSELDEWESEQVWERSVKQGDIYSPLH